MLKVLAKFDDKSEASMRNPGHTCGDVGIMKHGVVRNSDSAHKCGEGCGVMWHFTGQELSSRRSILFGLQCWAKAR